MANAQMHSAPGRDEASKEMAAAAFGLSAAITVVFNVVLAFIKDSYPPLNSFMAHLTGHHWRTHGLADVILFFVLGWFFMSRGIPASKMSNSSAVTLGAAVVIASAALGLWFLVV
jgi:cation transport ATPase